MQGIHLGLGYYIKPWFMIGAVTNYNWFKDNNGRRYKGFSDPQFRLKFRLVNKERWGFSLIPFFSLGLDQGKFTISNLTTAPNMNGVEVSPISDLGNAYGLKLSWEYIFNKLQLVVNLGYRP